MKPLVDLDTQLATMDADERLGLHDLPRLTSQQKVFVAARVSGLSISAASREAGCARQTGGLWDKDPISSATASTTRTKWSGIRSPG